MKYVLTIIGLLFLTFSCNKKCSSIQDTNSGLIVQTFSFEDCFLSASAPEIGIVIEDTAAFLDYQRANLKFCDTTSIILPDFSQFNILGINVDEVGCEVAYHRNVFLDTVAKEQVYEIRVESCGGCDAKGLDPNWVTVPVAPSGYTTVFNVSK